MRPEELLDPECFPDDLKWIPAHYKLHGDDPVYLLLAWHWRRMKQSEDAIQVATVELKAALDGRIEAITRAADTITALEETLLEVQAAMTAEQKKPVQAEPADAAKKEIKALVESLAPIARTFQEAKRRQLLAVFVGGLCLGVLAALVLFLR